MNDYPSSAELQAVQEQLAALHHKMHEFAKTYPRNQDDFIGIAVKLTDTVWKLDSMIQTAEHVERVEANRK